MKLTVVDPYDLTTIEAIDLVNWNTVDAWLDDAVRLNRGGALPKAERIEILSRAAALLNDRKEALAFLIAREGGKPLTDARVEANRAVAGLQHCVHQLTIDGGREIPMGIDGPSAARKAFTFHEPIGPVVAISAFNHPLNLIVHQVAPAIAVGCPVLVKPADDTPLCCRALVEIFHEAGCPEAWCRFAPCDTEVAERMATDPRVAFFSFIGSARVGWMLRSKLAPGTRCALEHGGAAPVLIDRDYADAEGMIKALTKGGFYHSGQVCVSVQRIFAPRDNCEAVAAGLVEAVSALKLGDAKAAETDCGPLIRPREVRRVDEWVREARDGGGQVLIGGEIAGETLYQPTVMLNPPADCRLSTEEIFGPVVALYAYDELDQAIAQANALPVAFQAAVFTDRLAIATRAARQLDASAIMVNDHTAFRTDWMPFGGHRRSGLGTGGIGYTMSDMQQEKMVVLRI